MTPHSDLIERLKRATGPDRELDALIACEVFYHTLRPARPNDHKEAQHGYAPGPGDIWCPTGFLIADSYTRNIDAALTLVPEGWQYQLLHTSALPRVSGRKYHASIALMSGTGWTQGKYYDGDADTLALSICIAALQAKSAQ